MSIRWDRIVLDMARGKNAAHAYRDELNRRTEEDAPTMRFNPGDLIGVWYRQQRIALVTVAGRLRNRSIEIIEGATKGKITFVGPRDIRFYMQTRPDTQTVLRGVTLKRLH